MTLIIRIDRIKARSERSIAISVICVALQPQLPRNLGLQLGAHAFDRKPVEDFLEEALHDHALGIGPIHAARHQVKDVLCGDLAGRCAGCAECERACPMDIPLNLLNRKMAKELKELYGHEAGFQAKEKGPLAEYREDDDQSFIK